MALRQTILVRSPGHWECVTGRCLKRFVLQTLEVQAAVLISYIDSPLFLTSEHSWRAHIRFFAGGDRLSAMGDSDRIPSLALPTTLLENCLESRRPAHAGGFLPHCLEKLVYQTLATALTVTGVVVCAVNLAFYG